MIYHIRIIDRSSPRICGICLKVDFPAVHRGVGIFTSHGQRVCEACAKVRDGGTVSAYGQLLEEFPALTVGDVP